MKLELPWDEFKTQVIANTYFKWTYFDINNHYYIIAKQNDLSVECKIYKDGGAEQVDFDANLKDSAHTNLIGNVQTQFEREDITLKIAKQVATFDVNGEAEISMLVPGVVGSGDVRYISGGFAFTDSFTFGDAMTSVAVVDVDNILGYGAHTVIKTYHDDEMAEGAHGWYMWPAPQAGGEIEIEPMGFYGALPAGLYIEIYFKLAPGSTATKVWCDIAWGKNV